MKKSMPSKSGGFSLLEVLVAFVVFALSFALVLQILSGSIRSTVRTRHDSEAALLAQSLMDMVGTEYLLEEGSFSGEAPGGYRWQLNVTPFEPVQGQERIPEIAELTGTVMYWVDLDIEWGDEPRMREVRFSTVKSVLASFQP